METSALNGNNIEKAFDELISDVYKNHKELFEKSAKVQISDNKGIDLDVKENKDNNEKKDENTSKKGCCW